MPESPTIDGTGMISAELRQSLVLLAEALVPLAEWIGGIHAPYQPDEAPVPWRPPTTNPPALTTAQLDVVGYLETYWKMLDEVETPLVEKLRGLQSKPVTKWFPNAWRVNRGLVAKSKFGAIDSENTPFVETSPSGERQVIRRAEFYETCWEPLAESMHTFGIANSSGPKDWTAFVKWLHRGEFGPLMAEFIRVLAVDVLHSLLNQDSSTLPSPQRSAVLIELGERRRPEQINKVADVTAAVVKLQSILANP